MSEIHALSGAYVSDALSELERAQFERHLAECGECQAEVSSLREVTAMLAMPEAPPAALKEQVLAQVRTIRPLPPQVQEVRPSRRWFPRLVAAAVAAVVLATGLTVWRHEHPSADHVATQVMTASDAVTRTVKLDRATLTVSASRSMGTVVMLAKNMPAAPPGRAYEMWLQQPSGQMVPAGMLTHGGDVTVIAHGNGATATAFGLTVEPSAGSTRPTTTPIALVDLRSA